jgi:hypothetical protein
VAVLLLEPLPRSQKQFSGREYDGLPEDHVFIDVAYMIADHKLPSRCSANRLILLYPQTTLSAITSMMKNNKAFFPE